MVYLERHARAPRVTLLCHDNAIGGRRAISPDDASVDWIPLGSTGSGGSS
jgi:hypothetical protein